MGKIISQKTAGVDWTIHKNGKIRHGAKCNCSTCVGRRNEDTCRYTGKLLTICRCKKGCDPTIVRTAEWIQPIRRGYRMACCDCGLAHLIDFRIYKGRVQFRAFREDGKQ